MLENVTSCGAEVVVTTCPLCQYNLDALQPASIERSPGFRSVPVFYFTQLLGVAMGLSEDDLALDYNTTDARPVLREKGLLE